MLSTDAFRGQDFRAELWLLVMVFVALFVHLCIRFLLAVLSYTSTARRSRLTCVEFPGPCHTSSMMQHCWTEDEGVQGTTNPAVGLVFSKPQLLQKAQCPWCPLLCLHGILGANFRGFVRGCWADCEHSFRGVQGVWQRSGIFSLFLTGSDWSLLKIQLPQN